MSKHPNTDPGDAPARLSRRARLQALVFAGAALATTLLTLGATSDPKLPRSQGE